MRSLMLLCVSALLAGCDAVAQHAPDASDPADLTSFIRYTRDARTQLCFAVLVSNTYGSRPVSSIASVPCDAVPAVLLTEIVR